ncbi:MAG: type I-E CRISPR-associated protein Cas7/Cse4/CasC [Spirochaetes bacterium GWF1_41_5]|nr:MAG: type I-E CRISPR-associated protein Cas7/Cse4/CasC [Spirochaetes bacterium GWF1_41_5]HBE03173.1 type I-E CRISPR-associated protein Cas7/Cse4/CasC [Spirochaetia bacterium]
MNNSLNNLKIEYHILQSFPVSCLNRDDVGAPKTAMIGGSSRARVSSQCWKRAVRMAMHDLGIKLGARTKLIEELIKEACLAEGASEEQALTCGNKVKGAFIKDKKSVDGKGSKKSKEEDDDEEGTDSADEGGKTDTLLFLSAHEAAVLAKAFKENNFNPEKVITQADQKKQAKEIAKILQREVNFSADGLDIALFGRMVAQAAELNVEAAASFSHAISTHKAANEVEFFTALDDKQTEPGAGHMGSLEFNSATYYRYISLDVAQLSRSLAGKNVPDAISAFTKALFMAVPAARQTTQSAACPWQYARILVRKGQRIQAPFDTPVRHDKNGGFIEPSKEELKKFLAAQEKNWGSLFGKIGEFEYTGDGKSIDELVLFLSANSGK